MLEAFHQGVVFLGAAALGGELLKPFAEHGVEGFVLGLSQETGLVDELFVGAEGDVFHTYLVYTRIV